MDIMQVIIDLSMTLLIIAVVPQIYKTYKNRSDIKDIDFKFSFLTGVGNILAIVWGTIMAQLSIASLNFVYLIWSLMSLYFMLRNRGKNK